MKFRILVLLVALFVGVFAVNAQDDCMGLASADCEVLTTGMMQTAFLSSYNIDFSFDLNLSGLGGFDPSMAGEVVTLNVDGTGSVAMGAGTNVPFNVALMMDVNAVDPDGETNLTGMELYIVDDILYVEEEGGDNTFTSTPLEDIGVQLEQAMGSAPFDPTSLFGGDIGGDAGDLPEFTTFVRNPDEDIMGQAAIPFEFTANFTELFQSPEFTSMVTDITTSMGGSDPQIAQMGPLVAMILPGIESKLVVTDWIGSDDGYMHRLAIDLDFSLDLAMMGMTEPMIADIYFEVNLHDFGAGTAIAAPANVTSG